MKALRRIFMILAIVALSALAGILALKLTLGRGVYLPDMSTSPRFDPSVLEVVADLDHPPGNIAVSKEGRVFITYHPGPNQTIKAGEIVRGKVVPYPDESYQKKRGGPGKSWTGFLSSTPIYYRQQAMPVVQFSGSTIKSLCFIDETEYSPI